MTVIDAIEDTSLVRRRERYVSDLLALHDRMSLRGLAEAVEPLYLARRDGLVVLVVPHSRVPERYRIAIHGFRLAQYLRTRFASAQIAFDRALFAEPHRRHGEEIHVLGLDESTGAILRYVSLVGSADAEPRALTDPDRALYPCEVAHGVNLFDHVPLPDLIDTGEVWEIKRLVQRGSEADMPAERRLRVSLELMLGLYTALLRFDPPARIFVGDGEEGLAIRRLLRSVKDVTVLEGTRPSLPGDDLFFPLYTQREVVKPFVARVPVGDDLRRLVTWLERARDESDPLAGFRELIGQVGGEIRRVRV